MLCLSSCTKLMDRLLKLRDTEDSECQNISSHAGMVFILRLRAYAHTKNTEINRFVEREAQEAYLPVHSPKLWMMAVSEVQHCGMPDVLISVLKHLLTAQTAHSDAAAATNEQSAEADLKIIAATFREIIDKQSLHDSVAFFKHAIEFLQTEVP